MDKKLVANRECGECRACCVYPAIDSDEFVKLSNVNCENLLANGKCNIYANRPSTCSEFFCAWQKMPELDESWRPDKLGILVEISNENFPNMFSGRIGFRFRILDKEKLIAALETCENLPEEKMRIENGKLISIATENQ